MHTEISKQTKRELLEALRERYKQSSKLEKTRILDEFVAVAGCHRKHAIRLLTGVDPLVPRVARRGSTDLRGGGPRGTHRPVGSRGSHLRQAPQGGPARLVAAMERHGHLALDPTVREHLLAVSPATIDRLLAPVRGTAGRRQKRKRPPSPAGRSPSGPSRTGASRCPGSWRSTSSSHGGSSMQGMFLWSLVATDVCSGWTEAVPLVAREQSLVVEGLEVIRRQFPVPIRGIDTDNDSAFINETLLAYCQEQQLEFTRSRAYQKNDQAWIEQKNGAVVRRFVGYERYTGLVAGQCLARLYQAGAAVRELLPAVVQAEVQDPRGGQGQEAVPQARDAVRAPPGSCLGLGRGQGERSGRNSPAGPVGPLASDPGGPGGVGGTAFGGSGPWSGTRESGGVPREAAGVVA